MLKTLLKSRFDAFWASFSGTGTANKKPRPKALSVLLIILFIFIVGYLMFAFAMVSFGLDMLSLETGERWASFTVTSMIASLLCVIGSVFTAKTQIFESKDNELLLSMPIEPKYIFLSRITMLLIVNFALESIVMLPSIAIHAFVVGFGFLEALFTLIVFILLPLFTLSLSVLLAWIISTVSARLKNKTLVNVIFTVLFLAIYMIGCGAFGGFIGASEELDIDVSFLKKTYIFYWMGSAMGEGNVLNLLFVALCAIIPASLAYFLLNRSFVKILTTHRGIKKVAYKEKSEKTSTPFTAVYKKELRRFFSSSAYILNAGMGNVMTVIVSVMAAFFSADLLPSLEAEPIAAAIAPTIISMMIIFMASMNLVSAPSISIEDKCLWIIQCSPVHPRLALLAKLLTHITICAPLTIVSAIVVGIAYKFSALNLIMLLLSSMSIVAFTGYFGLFLGLKFPKFDWQNETVAVKQGFAVFGTMLGSMLWTMIFFVVGIFLSILTVPFWVIGIVFTLANIIVCVPIHIYLNDNGAKRFDSLKH